MSEILRTPDERFAELPGWAYQPRYLQDLLGYQGLRMHYIDDGAGDSGQVFLCLHGQPTWSYLYRKMIPVFVKAGHRVIAPDFFGFGRSDKPVADETYTFDFHRGSVIAAIEKLDLENITLVIQDWGGLIGLTLPMAMADRVDGMLVMNTGLGTGMVTLPPAFLAWREFSNNNPDMAIGRLMSRACPELSEAECAAYDAPFPDVTYKAGVRQFPRLVPDSPDAPGAELSRQAAAWFQSEWRGRMFMAIGMQDEILGPVAMRALHRILPGCPEPMELAEAGHFVQEHGEQVAARALAVLC